MAKSFPNSYIVCTCKQVSLAEIIFAIKEKGAKTIEEIGNLTDAGTCCGSCRCAKDDIGEQKMELYIEEILNKFTGK